jgi:ASC-1-like (ASCH) protein
MPSNIRKYVNDSNFNRISSGTKKIEGFLNNGIIKSLKEGDTITFYNHRYDEVKVLINDIIPYESFDELLTDHLQDILPGILSIKQGIDIYLKPKGLYDKNDVNHFRIVAIMFEKINNENWKRV